MTERPQPKDLDPNSLLGKLIEHSVTRFQSTEIDQKHSKEFGYKYPYLLGQAARDTIETYLITSAKPSYIIAGLVSTDSFLTPKKIIPGLDNSEEDWNEIFIEIATCIVEEEIIARYPHLDEEDERRALVAGI